LFGWLKKILSPLARALVREPMQIAGLCAALIQFVSSQVVALTVQQQGALNAVVVAALGFAAAAAVSQEKAAPAFAGLIQAVLSVVLAFNVRGLDPSTQSAVMAFVAAGSAFFVRTQVVAHGGPPAGKHEAFQPMRG
jgi:hypothetical protein